MNLSKKVLNTLLVGTTLLMSSYSLARSAAPAAGKTCFNTIAEYQAVKGKMPALFQKLPVLLTLGGFANASIKVMDDGGQMRIQSAVWLGNNLTYGDEKVKEACLQGNKLTLKMWDGSDFFATIKSATSVHVQTPTGSGTFAKDEKGYAGKVSYINQGALKKGIKPAFGPQ